MPPFKQNQEPVNDNDGLPRFAPLGSEVHSDGSTINTPRKRPENVANYSVLESNSRTTKDYSDAIMNCLSYEHFDNDEEAESIKKEFAIAEEVKGLDEVGRISILRHLFGGNLSEINLKSLSFLEDLFEISDFGVVRNEMKDDARFISWCDTIVNDVLNEGFKDSNNISIMNSVKKRVALDVAIVLTNNSYKWSLTAEKTTK